MDRFEKRFNNDKGKKKKYDYKDKNYKILIIHSNNNTNSFSLSNLQSLSPIKSNNIDDIFILKNNLYIFTSKYCSYDYNKVFCSVETKPKYKKNCIYIKTTKYKIQLESIFKIKYIYRLYYIEFDSYNALFQHLTNKYIDIKTETAFKPDTIKTVYLI